MLEIARHRYSHKPQLLNSLVTVQLKGCFYGLAHVQAFITGMFDSIVFTTSKCEVKIRLVIVLWRSAVEIHVVSTARKR